jgi:hypothetical protein
VDALAIFWAKARHFSLGSIVANWTLDMHMLLLLAAVFSSSVPQQVRTLRTHEVGKLGLEGILGLPRRPADNRSLQRGMRTRTSKIFGSPAVHFKSDRLATAATVGKGGESIERTFVLGEHEAAVLTFVKSRSGNFASSVDTIQRFDGSQSASQQYRVGRKSGPIKSFVRKLGIEPRNGDTLQLKLDRTPEGAETLSVLVRSKRDGSISRHAYKVAHEAGAYTFVLSHSQND